MNEGFMMGVLGLALTGCLGSGADDRLSFVELDRSERWTLANEVTGGTEFGILWYALEADSYQNCPQLERRPRATKISGDCIDGVGQRWHGTLSVGNLGYYSEEGVPVTAVFEDFGVDAIFVDGSVSVGEDRVSSNVVVTDVGATVAVHASWMVSETDAQVIEPSTLELMGEGKVQLAGEWGVDPLRGAVALRGKQVLTLEFADVDDRDCIPTTLDGRPSDRICPQDAPTDDGGFAARAAGHDPTQALRTLREAQRRLTATATTADR